MKRIHILLTLLCFAAFAPSASAQSAPATGATQLYMVSNPGDYIGGGYTYSFTPAIGSFSAGGLDHDHDGLVDYVSIGFTGPNQWWTLTFTTTQLHLELKPGFYDKAMRAPFATAGHPGLEVTGDGRGCNTVTGSFTVLQATFDYSSATPRVISFAAQFEQHCEGGPISLAGVIYYNYTPTSSLRTHPATVNGGETVKGIVVLTDPAPPGGALVHLSSGNVALANVPSSVPVPQGSRFADFPISTTRIKSPSSVVILASYHGISSAATLRVVSPIPSISKLSLKGDPGDFIVGTHEYVYTPRDGVFLTWAGIGASGVANYFRLAFHDAAFTNTWNLHIATRNLNADLVPGYYTNAQRYPFEAAGHPGLSLSGNGRGCNTLTGEFTVLDAVFDYTYSDVQVVSFAADFIQHCEGATPAARGSIYYNYTPPSECVLSIAPLSQSFSANGGMGSFNVAEATNCSWTASTDVAWITIVSGVGTGNGTVSFSVGANAGASNRTGTITVSGQTFTVVQGIDFLDVPKTHAFYTEIAKLAVRGATAGCANGLYCPDELVTREQMAAFVMRSLGEFSPLPTAMQRFDDVPPTVNGQPNPFYSFIDGLAAFGITSGCAGQGQPLYCPNEYVTREQVAAFIIRALGEYDPPVPSSQTYLDVPPSNPFYAFIDRLGALRITRGCGGGNFCPGDYVTRGQMAALLVRAFGL